MQRIVLTDESLPRVLARLERDAAVESATRDVVTRVLADVKAEGLTRAFAYGAQFDAVDVDETTFLAEPEAMRGVAIALEREAPDLMAAISSMIGYVRAFATAQRASLKDVNVPLPGGGEVGERWLPLERVGVYVPGGRAFYPSTQIGRAHV